MTASWVPTVLPNPPVMGSVRRPWRRALASANTSSGRTTCETVGRRCCGPPAIADAALRGPVCIVYDRLVISGAQCMT
jgi:hypothetical protein